MSELTAPSEEFTLEKRRSLESVVAHDVLPNMDEYRGMVDNALDEGVVNVFPVENPRDIECEVASVSVPINRTDLEGVDVGFDELPTYIPTAKVAELGLSANVEVAKKEAVAVHDAALEHIVDSQGWFLGNSLVANEVESGSITQTFKINLGEGRHIDLINFSESKITDAHLSQLNDAVVRMFNATGGSISNAVSGIAVLPEARFDGKNLAGAHIKSRSITLSEVLINDAKLDAMQEEFGVKHNVLGAVSSFQATATHEMMHLVEGTVSEYSENNFRGRLGWVSEQQSFVDDYGNVVTRQRNRYVVPDRNQYVTTEDGKTQKVDVVEQFGREAYVTAKPVSVYGNTDGREDLAEASVAYFYGADIDPVRRNAVDNILNEVKGSSAPVTEVKIEEIEASDFKNTITISPLDLGVMISYRKDTIPEPNNTAHEGYANTPSRIGVVDDYGNLVERTTKMQPVRR